jgi:hypothetical protein
MGVIELSGDLYSRVLIFDVHIEHFASEEKAPSGVQNVERSSFAFRMLVAGLQSREFEVKTWR